VKEAGFKCLLTRNLNQEPLENTFGAIHSYYCSNNNPTVGHFVDALKTSIINGPAFRGLCETNCEDDGATLLDNLQSLFRAPDVASRNPSTSRGKETPDTVPESFHVAHQVQKDICAAVQTGDMEVFSVAYVCCYACKTLIYLPTLLFLVYYYYISLVWVYSLLFLPYYPLQY
jgi:hypothetical protein